MNMLIRLVVVVTIQYQNIVYEYQNIKLYALNI